MKLRVILLLTLSMLYSSVSSAQNPIIKHCYTADPAPMVFDGIDSLYVYCDEDMNVPGVNDYYFMERYRVFSTADMVNWTDHGESVMPRTTFKWLDKGVCWASQCVKKGNSYYWYVCGNPSSGYGQYGYNVIGVAKSDKPSGPFKDALLKPIIGAFGYIDPTVFVDDDDQAYMYFGNNMLSYVKLKSSMIAYYASPGTVSIPLNENTAGGYKQDGKIVGKDAYEEGPWLDKRGDNYYMLYAAGGVPEHISYSMSKSPEGPWEYKGEVMSLQNTNSFTNHCGIVNFRGHDYFFYHTGWLPGGGGFNRSISVEEFKFNANGTIPKITATKKGVKAIATLNPYIQQQAETMNAGVGVKVLGNEKTGVYVSSINAGDSIRVANVDFGETGPVSFTVRVACNVSTSVLKVRSDNAKGLLLGTFTLANTGGNDTWQEQTFTLSKIPTGVHDLHFSFMGKDDKESESCFKWDWWRFNTAEDETGIEQPTQKVAQSQNNKWYDLTGRTTTKPQKGVYIKNGKKLILD